MIRRKLFEDLKAHLLKKEYSIITGARQTGKSIQGFAGRQKKNYFNCILVRLMSIFY